LPAAAKHRTILTWRKKTTNGFTKDAERRAIKKGFHDGSIDAASRSTPLRHPA
jgi:hypothetical protein